MSCGNLECAPEAATRAGSTELTTCDRKLAMPIFSVMYKTEADHDGRLWPVGPFPDRDAALVHFNATVARTEGLGTFTFEVTSPFHPDYSMIVDRNHGAMFSLYKVK
jgi:hypothetical protein